MVLQLGVGRLQPLNLLPDAPHLLRVRIGLVVQAIDPRIKYKDVGNDEPACSLLSHVDHASSLVNHAGRWKQ